MNKTRTYAVFIDLKKAFDSVDRSILFNKLQILGFPVSICKLIHSILANLNFRVKQGTALSSSFVTSKGTPQGDPLSPLLFSLFLFDLPSSLLGLGVPVPDSVILLSCMLYADDTVLLGQNLPEMQTLLDQFCGYCNINNLQINITKTKFLVFHKGRLPKNTDVYIDGQKIERVSSFKYLGIYFTAQLSFTEHVRNVIAKASSRLGYLFFKLSLKNLPLYLALQIFQCFIFPMFSYGSHIWTSRISASCVSSLNALFLKFLKRYIGIPKFSSNSICYFLTKTSPLLSTIHLFTKMHPFLAGFPPSLSNLQLSFLRDSPPLPPRFDPIPEIPSSFWFSPVIDHLPSNPKFRRQLILPLVKKYFPDCLR